MSESLKNKALEKGYGSLRRHIFLCTGESCSPRENNLRLWEYLKNRLRDVEPETGKATVARSKTECLRLCAGGPLALVYPEGVLYHDLNEEKIDQIIERHLLGGEPVTEAILLDMRLT